LTAVLSPEARAVEAVLIVAVEPVSAGLLAELLELPVDQVEAVCEELAESCRTMGRGFEVARIAGGYRIQTHPDLASHVERFANVGVSSRLSAAALETLAIVAYKQPVSRAQIASLRGVNVDGVVRLLEHRGYIAAVGRAPGPGQAVLYATTDAFLERLGLDRVDQLPPVEDLLPGPEALAELEEQMRPVGDA
jgi:segregation and condensation protein B